MTSPVADASLTANSPSVYTDISGLSALKRDAKVQQSPETVRKVAQQFESIFAKIEFGWSAEVGSRLSFSG